ncbi:hypothetical protein WV31_13220 [Magnetospirillum sp. ME-1]|uniref:heparinase II/III family protein n=1 Tax=Magnetospirillum sp. ME-1 TaxID=1639348 RepID=UPI000A17E5F5|nr:heparinase II/III family protein [Magnetospirillum sp. ME-1]ARJ66560.1 hypothetical protein WV31_13220 [Magnetospirillum sp. ME-1]
MRPGPLWRWGRHLRPAQLAHRLWYRLRRPLFASSWWERRVLSAGPVSAALALVPSPPPWPGDAAQAALIAAGRIRLLGVEHPVGDWRAEGQSHLWRFTLHYFEWLDHLAAAGDAATARRLVEDWMTGHGVPDPLAWHPYPLSLRLFAWLSHAGFLLDGAEAGFAGRFLAALDRQAAHLARVPEDDVGGNHLIKNLKALVAACLCLPGRSAGLEHWLARLRAEIAVQVLDDGCHYELSPAYHVQVLCDLVDIARLLVQSGRRLDWLDRAIARMAGAFRFFRHGDGRLALFNDGAEGDAGTLAVLQTLLPPGPVPPVLPQAGYARLAAGPALVLLDGGRCCPDSLPAHAHADCLSFEMSLDGERVVVNSGTYAYQDSRWRPWFRGTAAHSTVQVGEEDSAELFGVFRLGRRPRRVSLEVDGLEARASHDGYAHRGIVHRRVWRLDEDGLAGEDVLDGPAAVAVARFHLDPGVEARAEGDGVALRTAAGRVLRFSAGRAAISVVEGVYAPAFGVMQSTRTLVAPLAGNRLDWRLDWRGGSAGVGPSLRL